MMEPSMVIALLAAAGVGMAIGFVWGRRQDDAREKQKKAEEELKNYKGQVAEHFGKTAELFDKLTHDYREVYEHLAESSENLCGDQVPRITADVPQGKLVADDEKPDLGAAQRVESVDVAATSPAADVIQNDAVNNDSAQEAEMPSEFPLAEEPLPEPEKTGEPEADEKKPQKKKAGRSQKSRQKEPASSASKTATAQDHSSSWKSPVVAPPAAEAVDPDIMADDDDFTSDDQPAGR